MLRNGVGRERSLGFAQIAVFELREVYHKYSAVEWEHMKPEERDAVAREISCSLFDDLLIPVDDVFDRVAQD